MRDEALRKIGRNLVNYQRFEKALKLVIVRSDIRGYASRIAKQYRSKLKDTNRKPLGWLVEEFLKTVYASGPAPEDVTDQSQEIWMSLAFRVEADGDDLRKFRSELRGVVKDRNDLIHDALTRFEPDSAQSCRDLISALDEQHSRFEPHFRSVMSVLDNLNTVQEEVLRQLERQLRKQSGSGEDAA